MGAFGAKGGGLDGERGHVVPAREEELPEGGTGDGAGAGNASAANELAEDMVVREQEA